MTLREIWAFWMGALQSAIILSVAPGDLWVTASLCVSLAIIYAISMVFIHKHINRQNQHQEEHR